MAGPYRDSTSGSLQDPEWRGLITRVAEGDQQALATLYDKTSRLVFGLVLRILSDSSAAEEVTLDVYTQVWRQASSYSASRGTPMAWLLTIARSRAIDRFRSGRQEQQRKESLDVATEQAAAGDSPERASALSEQRTIVRSALNELSAEQREVIELAYYQGLSHSEIAAQLGQPLGTVKTRTRLGMIKLRELLGPAVGALT
ncbi:MAG TPA: sigma-70 family RNA polymerase sigma factor [Blastocatellia bacterium]